MADARPHSSFLLLCAHEPFMVLGPILRVGGFPLSFQANWRVRTITGITTVLPLEKQENHEELMLLSSPGPQATNLSIYIQN